MRTIETEHFFVDVLWEVSPVESLQACLGDMVEGLDGNLHLVQGETGHAPGPSMEFGLHFVGDERMLQLNERYRQRPVTTDVLSFPVHEDLRGQVPGELPLVGLGDVIISIPRARRQSHEYKISLPQEVAHLLAHSFLHLLGFDHRIEGEAAIMFALEDRLVKGIYQRCSWEQK